MSPRHCEVYIIAQVAGRFRRWERCCHHIHCSTGVFVTHRQLIGLRIETCFGSQKIMHSDSPVIIGTSEMLPGPLVFVKTGFFEL